LDERGRREGTFDGGFHQLKWKLGSAKISIKPGEFVISFGVGAAKRNDAKNDAIMCVYVEE
jgi:hypothetical protein